jgi:hypothetical protein
MSEWLKEHAWKLIPLARADAHRNSPTHFRSTTSRNNDVHRTVPVNHDVCPGFQGVCDTVLTQNRASLLQRAVSMCIDSARRSFSFRQQAQVLRANADARIPLINEARAEHARLR